MEQFKLAQTYNTPEMEFDPESGVINITGRSIPEHPREFYKPIMDWIDAYLQDPAPVTTINFKVDYFNSSSFKLLIIVFEKFCSLASKGKQVSVNWYYEDDDEEMKDTGEEFQRTVKIPFTYIPVEEI